MASLLLKAFEKPGLDRRTCKREVPMKVLVFGMSRSGTSSMRAALKELGYIDTYHMSSVLMENPADADMWVEAFEAKFENKGAIFARKDWDQLLGHCMAVSDSPCIVFMDELATAYPDAKIILTVRDSPEQWYKSVQQTLVPYARMMVPPNPDLWTRIYQWFLPEMPFALLNQKIAQHTNFLEFVSSPEAGKKAYEEHNDIVRALCKDNPERLLEMNVKEGWGPLCKFLEKDLPTDANGEKRPFPRANDTATFNKSVRKYRIARHVLVAINVTITFALVGAVGYGGYKVWMERM